MKCPMDRTPVMYGGPWEMGWCETHSSLFWARLLSILVSHASKQTCSYTICAASDTNQIQNPQRVRLRLRPQCCTHSLYPDVRESTDIVVDMIGVGKCHTVSGWSCSFLCSGLRSSMWTTAF